MAHTAFEDTYLSILDIDGPDWADFLRYRMNDKINERLTTEQSWLLTSKERFAELMVGNTVYKRESDAKLKEQMEQRVLAARAEDKKKKTRGKGPFRLPHVKNPIKVVTKHAK